VPYSPLGRGFLTGKIKSRDTLSEGDYRAERYTRFQGDNLQQNLELVEQLTLSGVKRTEILKKL
jgi:aryl-alcohol dehydrogenase-like predicted oxidoreductase